MKRILLISIILLAFSCCNKQKTVKQVIIPIGVKIPLEAIKNDTIIIDSIPIVWINQDSIDRVKFKKDSIAFRKSIKAINGGYNGYKERYAIWLRARNAINKQNK